MESGPGNTFLAQNRKNQKIHYFRPQKRGGVIFSTFLTPPPHLPQNLKKEGFKWGGGLGGSASKTHWGIHLLDKIMILQRVKQTIQPFEVGHANSPKKVQMGGYVAFSRGVYGRAYVALI